MRTLPKDLPFVATWYLKVMAEYPGDYEDSFVVSIDLAIIDRYENLFFSQQSLEVHLLSQYTWLAIIFLTVVVHGT